MTIYYAWRRVCIVILVCAATVVHSPAQTFTTLLNFDGTNGASSYSSLVQGTDGNFYGTTSAGGTNTYGTVFKVTPAGIVTTLHNFDGRDGAAPWAGLVFAAGNFYGTTYGGGIHHNGTVFGITPKGKLTLLHGFDAADGANSAGVLARGADGNLYGTTFRDGANGYGTIFTITRQGTLTTLHDFDGTDGGFPEGGLVPLYNGNLIGTTPTGGANGHGTIFTITPQGTLTTLHNFDERSDGIGPDAGLVLATDGSVYGTTSAGGANGRGTVFKITTRGALTTIYNFQVNGGASVLVQATDGNFYGTTSGSPGGTLFKITPAGTFTTLHHFAYKDGEYPFGGVLQGTDGDLYGTTNSGGVFGYGTVFRLSLGLGPFVKTLPTSGKIGANVVILGTDLTGATSVRFNGTAAAFTGVSPAEILAIVPAGATTGQVQVTTPNGTLLSNVPFRVRP